MCLCPTCVRYGHDIPSGISVLLSISLVINNYHFFFNCLHASSFGPTFRICCNINYDHLWASIAHAQTILFVAPYFLFNRSNLWPLMSTRFKNISSLDHQSSLYSRSVSKLSYGYIPFILISSAMENLKLSDAIFEILLKNCDIL